MARTSATEQAATRRRLLDAAKGEFAERGLAGARFDEISLAAGHAKGTIYNYFPSKRELFLAVISDWCARLIEQVADDRDGAAERGQRRRLLAIAAADVAIAKEDPELATVVMQQMPSLVGADRAVMLEAIGPGLDLLTEAFTDGLRSGEFRSHRPPALLARLFLGILNTLEMEALASDPLISLADVVNLIDDLFLAGLTAAPSNGTNPRAQRIEHP